MNWEAVGSVGELLGAAGVIASLVYLAAQIRHNSRVVEAATSQAVSDAAQARLLSAAQSPSLAAALAKRGQVAEPLTPAELVQISYFRNAVFKGFENLFFQYRQGLIHDGAWTGCENILHMQLSNLGSDPERWSRARHGFDAEFRDLVDEFLRTHSTA